MVASIGIGVSTVLLINYITSILFTDLGSQRGKDIQRGINTFIPGMRNAGRRQFCNIKNV